MVWIYALITSVRNEAYLTEGDLLHLPYADASFDYILSAHSVLAPQYEGTHSEIVIQALREMRRVVRPGGRIRIWPASRAQVAEAVDQLGGLRIRTVLDPDGTRDDTVAIELERLP